jgi:Collagen triple helix repeat (20 copies)
MRKTSVALAAMIAALAATPVAFAATHKTTVKSHKTTVKCHLLVKTGKKSKMVWTTCPTSGVKAASGAPGAVGATGATGATGLQGSAGANGRDGVNGTNGHDGLNGTNGHNGLNGVSGYEVMTYDYIRGGARPGHDGVDSSYGGAGNTSVATVACSSPSKVAISGGYFVRDGLSEQLGTTAGNGVGVAASFPGRMDWNTNTPKANRNDGWIIQFSGAVAPTLDVTLYAICVNAA